MQIDNGPASSLAATARDAAPDRYFAALLAPRRARSALIAQAAFLGEVLRIPDAVREPAAGDIRLQWWREALASSMAGTRCGHPVADAWAATMVAHKIPLTLVYGQLDAVGALLDPQPFADLSALTSHLAKLEGAAYAIAARLLASGADEAVEQAAQASGVAYGGARLLHSLAPDHTRGRVLLPATVLAEAGVAPGEPIAAAPALIKAALARGLARFAESFRERHTEAAAHVRRLPKPLRCAFLSLALAPAYLDSFASVADPWHEQAVLSPLARLWRLWRAHSFGQFS